MDYQGRLLVSGYFAILATMLTSPARAQNSPGFSLPLDCRGNVQCALQNMVDLNPGPKHQDPLCGVATYNGHKGTDIRVRDIGVMRSGVPILAMADGIVVATRDGVVEKLIETKVDRQAVKGRECGNGVLIRHQGEDGKVWTTQTCHLARNSVKVSKGEKVKRGQVIAQMGLSGSTQFPHVHVSVRFQKQIVDPITATEVGKACRPRSGKSLFSSSALDVLQSLEKNFLDSGFASATVTGIDLLKGLAKKPEQSGPLIFYAKLLNLVAGDRIRLTITGPDGIFARSTTKPLSRPKATYTAYTGKRGALDAGTYSGRVELIRNGEVIFTGGRKSVSF